jgi:hypothetical protein
VIVVIASFDHYPVPSVSSHDWHCGALRFAMLRARGDHLV